MFRQIKKLWNIIKYFYKDEDNLLLHLMEMKANECLEDCTALEVADVEELEDMLFHIKIYYEIPKALIETKYPEFEGENMSNIIRKFKEGIMTLDDVDMYADFLTDVENQRALERDIIFDQAKILTFGFKL